MLVNNKSERYNYFKQMERTNKFKDKKYDRRYYDKVDDDEE